MRNNNNNNILITRNSNNSILQEINTNTTLNFLDTSLDDTVIYESANNSSISSSNGNDASFLLSSPSNNHTNNNNISTTRTLFTSPPSTRRRLDDTMMAVAAATHTNSSSRSRSTQSYHHQPKTPTSLPHKKISRKNLLLLDSPTDDEHSLVSFNSNSSDCIMAGGDDDEPPPTTTTPSSIHDSRRHQHSLHPSSSSSSSSIFSSQPPVKNLFRENSYPGVSSLCCITTTECSPIAEEISPTDVTLFPFTSSPLSSTTTNSTTAAMDVVTPVKFRSTTTNTAMNPSFPNTIINHHNHTSTTLRSNLPPPTLRKIPPLHHHPHSRTTPPPPPPPRTSSCTTTATAASSRFSSDFYILHEIGTGSFGTVYKVRSRLDGCTYAIKCVRSTTTKNYHRKKLLKEVHALAALSDLGTTELGTLHIVRYHQAWMEDHQLYIQTELCTGTLFQEMRTSSLLQEERRRYKVLRELLLALELLHRKDMVHLDIKPENIFIRNDQYKLGDFGLVSKITRVYDQEADNVRYQPAATNDVEEGDSRYMSRELLTDGGTTSLDLTKCDIFSLGATLYEICSGQPLPPNGPEWHTLRDGIHHTTAPHLPHTSYELKRILGEMMHPDPNQRPTAKALLQLRPLLSEDQQQLIIQQNKVAVASRKLAEEEQRLQKLYQQQPKHGMLIRRATWDVDTSNRRW
jgi:tRNA A-37 threonylcarbamoyl transferase component Bud32